MLPQLLPAKHLPQLLSCTPPFIFPSLLYFPEGFFLPFFPSIGNNQLLDLLMGLNEADITTDQRAATLYKHSSLKLRRLRLENRLRETGFLNKPELDSDMRILHLPVKHSAIGTDTNEGAAYRGGGEEMLRQSVSSVRRFSLMCTSNAKRKREQKSALAGLCAVCLCTCVCMRKYCCAHTGKGLITITKS